MYICENKIYIEKQKEIKSREELKLDIRAGCLNCDGYRFDCADRIDVDENGERKKVLSEFVKFK